MSSLLAALLLAAALAGYTERPWCSSPAVAAGTVARLRDIVEEQGAEGEDARRTYGLAAMPRDSVLHVTDERLCERAARVYYRHHLGPFPPGGVTVVRAGNRYAVVGAIRAGEWTVMTIYSEGFEAVAHIAT